MSTEELLQRYEGHIVPQSYNAGFVALSYVVSLVGAGSTLELINRRTGLRGLFNHLLLMSSAVTMGGVSIWCMHFIGNRAIDLANGQPELQVAYSSGFTAISFFVPILVLLAAFMAVGTNNVVSWWRLVAGGILCGTAPAYVIGSAIIAIVASNVALAMFFVFRAMWANAWWKRVISAVVLAGAVSGMHWCAAVGTRYRLKRIKPNGNEPSRTGTVVVVICLSLGACFIIATSAILRARNMRRSALRAQQITLAAAIFDKGGRILVDPDGYIPSTVVTDSFLEKNAKEGFNTGHPLFHWMYQASRNWNMIWSLVGGMRQHVSQLPHSRTHKDGRRGIQLVSEHGETIDSYDMIFRELFCLAAAALADRLREDLASIGVLWDQILPTGASGRRPRTQLRKQSNAGTGLEGSDVNEEIHNSLDITEKGLHIRNHDYGRGSLMFLVRRSESDRDTERLISTGYRFAELHQVSDLIKSSMQIQSPEFETKLREMATYTSEHNHIRQGTHLGFFAVRARVSSGFEVLVRKGARHLLPTMPFPFTNLEDWHMHYLRRFDNVPVSRIVEKCREDSQRSDREAEFAGQIADTIKALREWTQEPLLEDALLTSTAFRIPCRGDEKRSEATMIALRLVIPIHSVLSSPNCEFVPLSFFRMRQVSTQSYQEFTRGLHQEFGHIAKAANRHEGSQGSTSPSLSSRWPFGRSDTSRSVRIRGKSISNIAGNRISPNDWTRSSSTINLCSPGNNNVRTQSIDSTEVSGTYLPRQEPLQTAPSYGGIMVFQEITVDVQEGGEATARKPSHCSDTETITIERTISKPLPAAGIELQSMGHFGANDIGTQLSNDIEAGKRGHSYVTCFVDVLFAKTVTYPALTYLDSIAITVADKVVTQPAMSPLASVRRGTLGRYWLPAVMATSAAALVYSYRPRDFTGHTPPAVPPPTFGADGTFKLPRFPRIKSRKEQLNQLRESSRPEAQEYDMLVIGGGATGAGVALDAATRGLKVAVVERDDFSSGTSSKSTKLVHGGVRYLEKAVWNLDYNQYLLVKEALKERNEGIEGSYFLTRSKALEAFPMLKPTDLVGALVYYDGAHNDSRMNVSIAMTAALYGATVVNHAEVTGLLKDKEGRLCGARVKDLVAAKDGQPVGDVTVRAKSVINCTGPFTDSVRKMDDQDCKDIVAPAAGVHVILPGYFSPGKMGLIDPSTSDGRVIFFLPWQGNTIAGTTDSPSTITPNPLPDEKSIEWILSPKAKNTESLVRNHLIDISPSGLLTCAGGKWTTYRQMAEECVDVGIREFGLKPRPVTDAPRVSGTDFIDDGAILDGKCQTHKVRLVGAHGFSPTLFIPLIQHFGVETEVARHLTESYGDRAWTVASLCKLTDKRFPAHGERISQLYPFVDGEIRYAVRHEYAQTAVDVLARRTRLAFLNAQAALEALPKVIDIMARELKWDPRRKDLEWKELSSAVAYLESMGLPKPMLTMTRKQVEQGKLDFVSSLEWQMYSRHDKPTD
ncbi:Signaling protein ykoW [Fusarium austroafricanum]|uniref:Glycerol-3-phosphate dehydrogenase n=1 Tax=Fusarium austroafricanum TaxID=2364996 RepID=A0A8H4K900_9HYPO|nr:Signaling protein ykoW [Fusarium austroafricanum]